MVAYEEQIKIFEEELRKTPYNKRTQHHVGLVKAKIARLRDRQVSRSKGKGKTEGYTVRKSGDATVVLVGFPSVGKSTLLNQLTNAESKTASYAFTTLTCIPGLMRYKSAKIQILDLPGILRGAAKGVGKGREILSVLRTADLVLAVIDVFEPVQLQVIKKELNDSGMRLNETKPIVKITKAIRGGVDVASTVKLTKLQSKTIQAILNEFRINNAHVLIREDITAEQLIDVIEGNKKYVPLLVLVNKIDLAGSQLSSKVKKLAEDALWISAETGQGMDEVKEAIFNKLGLMRIYLKKIGREEDMEEPLIIGEGATIRNVCEKLHREFVLKFRFARVWGKSAKFPAQRFNLKHVLQDGDILQLYLR